MDSLGATGYVSWNRLVFLETRCLNASYIHIVFVRKKNNIEIHIYYNYAT